MSTAAHALPDGPVTSGSPDDARKRGGCEGITSSPPTSVPRFYFSYALKRGASAASGAKSVSPYQSGVS